MVNVYLEYMIIVEKTIMEQPEIKESVSNLQNAYERLKRGHQYEGILQQNPTDLPNKQDFHEMDSVSDEYLHTVPQQLEPSGQFGQTVFKSKRINTNSATPGTSSVKIHPLQWTREGGAHLEPVSCARQYIDITDVPRIEQLSPDEPKDHEYLALDEYDEIQISPNDCEDVYPINGQNRKIVPERKGTLPVPGKPPGYSQRNSQHARNVLITVGTVLAVGAILTIGVTFVMYFSIDRQKESTKEELIPSSTADNPVKMALKCDNETKLNEMKLFCPDASIHILSVDFGKPKTKKCLHEPTDCTVSADQANSRYASGIKDSCNGREECKVKYLKNLTTSCDDMGFEYYVLVQYTCNKKALDQGYTEVDYMNSGGPPGSLSEISRCVNQSFDEKLCEEHRAGIRIVNAFYGDMGTKLSCSQSTISDNDCRTNIEDTDPTYAAEITDKCEGKQHCEGLMAKRNSNLTQCNRPWNKFIEYVTLVYTCEKLPSYSWESFLTTTNIIIVGAVGAVVTLMALSLVCAVTGRRRRNRHAAVPPSGNEIMKNLPPHHQKGPRVDQ